MEKELFEIEKALSSNRRKQMGITVSLRESDGLQKDIDQLTRERVHLAEQASYYQRMLTSNAHEFAIVTDALPASFPSSSTKKIWFNGTILLSALITLLWLLWREYRRTRHYGRDLAFAVGLDSLGTLSDPTLRRIATAIRDESPDYGEVIAFTGDGHVDPWPWAIKLARRFAVRDERVLVIDTRFSETEGIEG